MHLQKVAEHKQAGWWFFSTADEGDETGRVEEAMEDDGEGEDDIEEGREGEEEDLMLAPGDTSHEFVEELEDDAVEESLLSVSHFNIFLLMSSMYCGVMLPHCLCTDYVFPIGNTF